MLYVPTYQQNMRPNFFEDKNLKLIENFLDKLTMFIIVSILCILVICQLKVNL